MRKSDAFLLAILMGCLATGALAGFEGMRGDRVERRLAAERRLVETLGLTDLCLFTEARFTRHPTQADLHAAFQEAPGAVDLFPSGSLVTPPVFNSHRGAAE